MHPLLLNVGFKQAGVTSPRETYGTLLLGGGYLFPLGGAAYAGFSVKVNDILSTFGVLLYAAIGLGCLLLGANFLDYSVLPFPGASPEKARYLGMLGIEIAVGISVMAIMVSIFLNLLGSETPREEGDGIHR